ncbi:Fanconi anemia group M protein [Larimichthys crocea]|uniref:Fanconi anemia group M protein n=1 Tax=Larimichthys crocea TaxID=215358 RepID=A0A6G0IFN3_LARCR|nr:Fanconi anemia group M protein [Larimichthys crocea]
MVIAVYEAEKSLQLDNANSFQHDNPVATESTSFSESPSSGQTYPDFPGFDSSSAKVWIYPTNYPIRGYQMKISEAALFQNTLVCLPTGLGKTFIASVVMYNFYRWYPAGKIVFMAPTKPLVAQQIEACYKVMGIPQAHMAELTGSTAAKQRQEVWKTKRVFFLTPQVMVNDLSRETCPAKQIKCVVIDEAHKALGNHAYCQVIKQLSSQTLQFRILALSATPGGDAKSVQSVISNLLISHIELRSDESPDIQAHSHQRSVDKVVVPLGEALTAHQARYLQHASYWVSYLEMD